MPGTIVPKRPLRIALLILIALLVIFALFDWSGFSPLNRSFVEPTYLAPEESTLLSNDASSTEAPHRTPEIDTPSHCTLLNISNIAFVTKTGATEAKQKLPPQLSTCLRCVPDPLIFSDLDQTLGPYQVHDVLSRFTPEAMIRNHDFDIYRKQKDLVSHGHEEVIQDLGSLPSPGDDWRTEGNSASWALDKYKFLHMIERAWEYQPGRDWYVFIEADTYLSLANLEQYLAKQDPREKLYFGSGVRMFEHPTEFYFAHGGSGFILSGGAVKDFAVTHKGLASSWDYRIRYLWFGDYIVANALDEALDVQLTDILPLIQGNSPNDCPFGEESWCKPIVTMHHVIPDDFTAISVYETSRDFAGMLYRDLYALFFRESFPSRKDNWQNFADNGKYAIKSASNPVEQLSNELDTNELRYPDKSFDACETSCIQEPDCLQFSYHSFQTGDNKCYLSTVFRFGHAIESEEQELGMSVSSGWQSDRIGKWVEEHQDCSTARGDPVAFP